MSIINVIAELKNKILTYAQNAFDTDFDPFLSSSRVLPDGRTKTVYDVKFDAILTGSAPQGTYIRIDDTASTKAFATKFLFTADPSKIQDNVESGSFIFKDNGVNSVKATFNKSFEVSYFILDSIPRINVLEPNVAPAEGKFTFSEVKISTDTADIYEWDERTTLFDDQGVKVHTHIKMDNKISIYEFYENGILTQKTIDDEEDTEVWDQKYLTFDTAGDLLTEITIYDFGIIQDTKFKAGKIYEDRYQDLYSGQDWKVVKDRYDANGDLAWRMVEYDNQVKARSQFKDGVILHTRAHDEGDMFTWEKYVDRHDASGELVKRKYIWDDGSVSVDTELTLEPTEFELSASMFDFV